MSGTALVTLLTTHGAQASIGNHLIVGGTKLAAEFAESLKKPLLHLTMATGARRAARQLDRFITRHRIHMLNLAGPRDSEEPGIRQFVQDIFTRSRLLARARQRGAK